MKIINQNTPSQSGRSEKYEKKKNETTIEQGKLSPLEQKNKKKKK